MNHRLSFTLFCVLFAPACFAESSTTMPQTTTVNQPQPTPSTHSSEPTTPTQPQDTTPITDMVDFCKEHTC